MAGASTRIKAELSERLAELERRGPRARGAAAAPADDVRSRDDQGDRLLPRHRELLAASLRARCPASRRRRCSTTCPADALIIVDESHQTRAADPRHVSRRSVAQGSAGRATGSGCRRRSTTGRSTSRSGRQRVGQVVYVSATPGPYELQQAGGVIVEQIIRPTGLVDPVIDVRPVAGQVDDLLAEIRDGGRARASACWSRRSPSGWPRTWRSTTRSSACASATCTRTSTRSSACRSCATCGSGTFDVLVGINLLREGLDLPEVSLVAILDADKEGFLRSAGALIQTIGRAARNVNGRAILYADVMTDSMRQAMDETDRRRTRAGGLQRRARHHAGVDHQEHRRRAVERVRARLRDGAEGAGRARAVQDAGRARRVHRAPRAARCGRRPPISSSSAPPRFAIGCGGCAIPTSRRRARAG